MNIYWYIYITGLILSIPVMGFLDIDDLIPAVFAALFWPIFLIAIPIFLLYWLGVVAREWKEARDKKIEELKDPKKKFDHDLGKLIK